MTAERETLELQLRLLEHSLERYITVVNEMPKRFEMTDEQKEEVRAKAEETIAGYNKDITAIKEELNKFVVEDLKKELLETGKLDQQKIEDKVQQLGITSIELSPEAQEMKKHQGKVANIFNKHLNKDKGND